MGQVRVLAGKIVGLRRVARPYDSEKRRAIRNEFPFGGIFRIFVADDTLTRRKDHYCVADVNEERGTHD